MKEIWTLIELANQYEIEKEKSEWVNVDAYVEFKWDYNNNWLARYDETDRWEWDNLYWDTAVAYLISKSFGMIWWLVENEKINWEKFQEPKIRGIIWLISNWHNSEWKSYKDYSKELAYESLLMLLSISDTPIEDLISYLK